MNTSLTTRRWRPDWRSVTVVIAVVVALVAALAIATLAWIVSERWNQWEFRRLLPGDAQDVHELIHEYGFLPDYTYQLKAKISDEQFRQYVERLGLTPHFAGRQYSDVPAWLNWKEGEADWWDPSESLDATYVEQIGETWTFAKHERGYLYLMSLNH
jgi:hypothetical protein